MVIANKTKIENKMKFAKFSENSFFHLYIFCFILLCDHFILTNKKAYSTHIRFAMLWCAHWMVYTQLTYIRHSVVYVRCLLGAISLVRINKKPWRVIRVCIIKIYICAAAAIIIIARIILWGVCLKPLHQLIFFNHIILIFSP